METFDIIIVPYVGERRVEVFVIITFVIYPAKIQLGIAGAK